MTNVPVKSKMAAVKVTPEQDERIQQRAKQCGMRKSAWMRSILVQAANQPAKDGFIRIREPNGATT